MSDRLDARRDAGLMRSLSPIRSMGAVDVEREGERVVVFSSNDYLGFSAHPDVRKAMADSVNRYGAGPRGSALVCGFTEHHAALQYEIATLKKADDALLFPTGYAANLGVISTLGGPDCTIFSDELNHASIIDGIGLARRRGAALQVYRHADMNHLEELLAASDARRKMVVTDGVFSMDGDLAPMRELAELRDRYGFFLVVDEAHSTLVFGERGAGVAEHFGVEEAVDLYIGTLSKAAAGLGGFAAGSSDLIAFLLNEARTFVFSTALPVPIVNGVRAAIRLGRDEPEHRDRLFEHVSKMSDELGIECVSPIVPIVVGEPEETIAASKALDELGFHVTGIRPPTVPEGTSRLRIALSAAHLDSDIDGLLDALRSIGLV